ncbi:MAG: FIST C-terminal domain-containing protein [Myxococcaceae bacterium]|nr:FIST C-terminal domain-containing protein [Myxococcaceae bacterium]
MTTRTATGQSTQADTREATSEAFATALAALGGPPDWCLVFAGPDRDLSVIDEVLHEEAPRALVQGCHTAGEFTERGLSHGAVALMLLSSDELLIGGVTASGARADPLGVAQALAAPWEDLSSRAGARGLGAATSVLLVDGLAGGGDRIVKEYQGLTRVFQQIVGGAAGDEGRFHTTGVLGPGGVTADGASVTQVFGKQPWGAGAAHGLEPASKQLTVTKAKGSRLMEIDGKPAFEAYVAHAASKGITLTEENRGRYLIGNEIGVFVLDTLHHARAPVGVEPDGSLKLVADISEGARICILDGRPDAMVEACSQAARQARSSLKGRRAAGVLVFDCVCRGMILGAVGFEREIDAVRRVFPGTPVLGFLTYGEIARFGGRLDGWHNTTSVVAAIPA